MSSRATGRLVILSAPSGAGKTSLARALIEARDDTVLSVSHTTRAPRPGECDGVDYHFVDHDAFQVMIAEDAFLEFAEVFGNFYGTARSAVSGFLARGMNVILDIDWQGARKVRGGAADALSVFILPPTLAALRERLTRRAQDSDEVIEARMRKAIDEMRHYDEYDRVVVNCRFEQALAELSLILDGGDGGVDPGEIDFKALDSIDKTATLAP